MAKACGEISSADGTTPGELQPAPAELDAVAVFQDKAQQAKPHPRAACTAVRQAMPGSREESPAERKAVPGGPGDAMILESSGAGKSAETVGTEGKPPSSEPGPVLVLQRETRRPAERSPEGSAGRDFGSGIAPPFAEDAVQATRPGAVVPGEAQDVAASDEGRQARLGDGGLEQLVLKARLARSGRKETFEVLLEPPGAGRVQVEIVSKDGMLDIRLKAEDETARCALERDISRLGRRLAAEGLKVARLEVGGLREAGGWQDGTAREGNDHGYPARGWPDANPQGSHPGGRSWGEERPGSGWYLPPERVGGPAKAQPAAVLGSFLFGGVLLDARA